jgi:hypothetical protein
MPVGKAYHHLGKRRIALVTDSGFWQLSDSGNYKENIA